MNEIRNFYKKPAHLPERLTISFPIWGIADTDGTSPYADYDRMMIEHRERGFNCIRLEGGAGLIHDLQGNRLPPVHWGYAFGACDEYVRQSGWATPGLLDVRGRLLELFRAAKRHDMYIIISSWYYLHTFWYLRDRELNDSLTLMDEHKRFDAFAKFLHYIICDLEAEGLDSQLAVAEIFNEANGLEFCLHTEDGRMLTGEEKRVYRAEHEAALEWLQKQHPQILFAYDGSNPWPEPDLFPANAQVYNAHNYFMWNAYNEFERDETWLKDERIERKTFMAEAMHPDLVPEGWVNRVYFYSNLDTDRIEAAEKFIEERFLRDYQIYLDKLEESSQCIEDNARTYFPEALVICGEGVSYSGTDAMQWEEKCPEYWRLLERMALRYRQAGMWGSVVRTCCGPEDPVWTKHPEKLLHINRMFLNGADE